MSSPKAKKQIDGVETVSWDDILKENKEINFILSDKQMEKILEYIGNTTDGEKYIIDKKTKERELSIDSSEIRKEEIGAIFPGSKVFIKKNIAGFSQYLAEYHHKFL